MTEQNLKSAFAGESQAHVRYLIFADRAADEGFKNVSRLFQAIAYAELIHARNHFRNLEYLSGGYVTVAMAGFGPGNTAKNLSIAIDGEEFEINEMYPSYLEVAKLQGEKGAERSFHGAYEAEKVHAEMFKRALKSVETGNDVEMKEIQICEICGYTVEGDAPDKCPICGASKNKFKAF